MRSGIDYIQEQISRGNEASFASNRFSNEEALQFFQRIEQLGGHVTIPTIYFDNDGPGKDYADACEVHIYPESHMGRELIEIQDSHPDDVEHLDDVIWLWWD